MNEYAQIDKDHFVTVYDQAIDFGTPMEEFRKIAATMPDRVKVLASGGIDSEAMVKLLQKCGKEVTSITYKLEFGGNIINEHDFEWLEGCLPEGNIIYRKIRLEGFWESDWFWDFVAAHKCASPQMALQSFMAWQEQMYQYKVLPAIHPEPKMWGDKVVVQIREKDFSTLRHFTDHPKVMVSPLQSNANIYASLLNSNEFQNFASFGLQDGRDRKPQQYKEWFDLDLEPRPKYHGFEHIQDEENQIRNAIYRKFGYSETWMFVPIDQMLSNFKKGPMIYRSTEHHHIIQKGYVL